MNDFELQNDPLILDIYEIFLYPHVHNSNEIIRSYFHLVIKKIEVIGLKCSTPPKNAKNVAIYEDRL